MNRTEEDWIEEYRKKGALWIHDGNPKRPHVRLTKGKHSNGFFNSRFIMSDDVLLYEACKDLMILYARAGYSPNIVDRIVGPETGGTKVAKSLALNINMAHRFPFKKSQKQCLSSSTKKGSRDGKEIMVWDAPDPHCGNCNERVLLCDDALSTGGSLRLSAMTVSRSGRIILPAMLVPVNRSGKDYIDGRRIISLINEHMPAWTRKECPLCKMGSEVLFPPKDPENWERLNAEY